MAADDTHFQLLRSAARSQPEPQRLLFVFAAAALPDDATPEQRARFDAGAGGELDPVMSVDKDPDALTTFDALVEESRHTGQPWQVMFAAGLSGVNGEPPTTAQTVKALDGMLDAVRQGHIGGYIAYDVRGEPLSFS